MNLFADDTTTFLAVDDDFGRLQALLDDWCIALTAKFNVKKTEVIPIGSSEFQRSVIATQRTKDESNPIPEDIKIAGGGVKQSEYLVHGLAMGLMLRAHGLGC